MKKPQCKRVVSKLLLFTVGLCVGIVPVLFVKASPAVEIVQYAQQNMSSNGLLAVCIAVMIISVVGLVTLGIEGRRAARQSI